MRLDRHAGESESPRVAELAVDHFGAVAAAGRAEESAVGFEAIFRCGESERCDLRSDDAVFGCAPRMKRLGHRAEVFAQPACLRRADAERAPRGLAIETEKFRGARGGADRPARRGAVKAVLVVPRQNRLGDLAFDFDADLIGEHQIRSAAPVALGQRQHRRQRRRGRMRQQAVDAVLGDRKLRVVVIVGVNREAVGECGETRGHSQLAADHGAAFVGGDAQLSEIATRDVARLRRRARERESDSVEHRALAQMRHVFRNVARLRAQDETRNVIGQRRVRRLCSGSRLRSGSSGGLHGFGIR